MALTIQSGKLAAIKALLEAGADQNARLSFGQGQNILLFSWILLNEKFPIAELFITYGECEYAYYSGATLLKSIRNAPHTPRGDRIIKFLVEHGAHE